MYCGFLVGGLFFLFYILLLVLLFGLVIIEIEIDSEILTCQNISVTNNWSRVSLVELRSAMYCDFLIG